MRPRVVGCAPWVGSEPVVPHKPKEMPRYDHVKDLMQRRDPLWRERALAERLEWLRGEVEAGRVKL